MWFRGRFIVIVVFVIIIILTHTIITMMIICCVCVCLSLLSPITPIITFSLSRFPSHFLFTTKQTEVDRILVSRECVSYYAYAPQTWIISLLSSLWLLVDWNYNQWVGASKRSSTRAQLHKEQKNSARDCGFQFKSVTVFAHLIYLSLSVTYATPIQQRHAKVTVLCFFIFFLFLFCCVHESQWVKWVWYFYLFCMPYHCWIVCPLFSLRTLYMRVLAILIAMMATNVITTTTSAFFFSFFFEFIR